MTITAQLVSKYGHLITQENLAELLHRSVGGLRWSLSQRRDDPANAYLRKIEIKIGKRRYYPADKVAKLLDGSFLTTV